MGVAGGIAHFRGVGGGAALSVSKADSSPKGRAKGERKGKREEGRGNNEGGLRGGLTRFVGNDSI